MNNVNVINDIIVLFIRKFFANVEYICIYTYILTDYTFHVHYNNNK